jgi:hypothetical protein
MSILKNPWHWDWLKEDEANGIYSISVLNEKYITKFVYEILKERKLRRPRSRHEDVIEMVHKEVALKYCRTVRR